jgi:hypothetical protein
MRAQTFVLLALGALIDTWNSARTILTIVSFGRAALRPANFFAQVAVTSVRRRGHWQLMDDSRRSPSWTWRRSSV